MTATAHARRLARARQHCLTFDGADLVAAAEAVAGRMDDTAIANPELAQAARNGLVRSHGRRRKPLRYPDGLCAAIARVAADACPDDVPAACRKAEQVAMTWMTLNQPQWPL